MHLFIQSINIHVGQRFSDRAYRMTFIKFKSTNNNGCFSRPVDIDQFRFFLPVINNMNNRSLTTGTNFSQSPNRLIRGQSSQNRYRKIRKNRNFVFPDILKQGFTHYPVIRIKVNGHSKRKRHPKVQNNSVEIGRGNIKRCIFLIGI
ncbi:hypothetical protein D3C80_1269070 [compost metagenome]